CSAAPGAGRRGRRTSLRYRRRLHVVAAHGERIGHTCEQRIATTPAWPAAVSRPGGTGCWMHHPMPDRLDFAFSERMPFIRNLRLSRTGRMNTFVRTEKRQEPP